MKKKVLIINEGYSSNLGDQAIKDSLFKLFSSKSYDVDFAYYSNPSVRELPSSYYKNITDKARSNTGSVKKKRSSLINFLILIKNFIDYYKWIFKNEKLIKSKFESNSYDVVVIGGGQLINTTNKAVPSYFSIAMKFWVKYASNQTTKPAIYIIAVGVASEFNSGEKRNYAYALRRADEIWVRDEHSKNALNGIFDVKANLIPDIAFYTDTVFTRSTNSTKKCLFGIYSYREFAIKFNKKSLDFQSYYDTWVVKLLQIIEEGYDVELFYTTETDAVETFHFDKFLQENYQLKLRTRIISSLPELYDLYTSADMVYSARMHALLLAKKFGCKVEAYIISQKLQSFNDEFILPAMDAGFYKKSIEAILEDYI